MEKNYYLGLDLGSNSVGWAATDEDYNFLRLKGKTAWGARIFSEAKDCKERRTYRSNKRRLARRKYRLVLLKQLFAEEMAKVDKTFFLRLANSTYWEEDKAKDSDGNEIGKNLIFKTYEEEKQYYTKYPTIWHLRKALIENDEDALSNLRYVYLAIHHIVKYRGNFLTEGEFKNEAPTPLIIDEINQTLSLLEENNENTTIYIKPESYKKLIEILTDNNLTKSQKKGNIDKLFIPKKERSENVGQILEIFKTIIVGGTYSIKKDSDTEDNKTIKICFTENFENLEADISKALGDAFNLVLIAKKFYDYMFLKELLGDDVYQALLDDIELLDVAGDPFDFDKVRAGELTPMFFGSAMTNFGVKPFLEKFLELAPSPAPRQAVEEMVQPTSEDFSALVFKIQANMDPNHHDRIVFMRICSGKFEKGMSVLHRQSNKTIRLSQPQQFLATERTIVEDAYPGDIIGVFDAGTMGVGDTLCAQKHKVTFGDFPVFPPEFFARVSPKDTMKRKQFQKGMTQLAQEGAVQIFEQPGALDSFVVGAVGMLQFEVLEYRLKNEYGVDLLNNTLPYSVARWIDGEVDIASLKGVDNAMIVKDNRERTVVLISNEWQMGWVQERNPDVTFLTTPKLHHEL